MRYADSDIRMFISLFAPMFCLLERFSLLAGAGEHLGARLPHPRMIVESLRARWLARECYCVATGHSPYSKSFLGSAHYIL